MAENIEYSVTMENEHERLEKFLLLFGLGEDFSYDDLSRSYRALARLNHPDVNRGVEAAMRMTIINEGYDFLSVVVGAKERFFSDSYYSGIRSSSLHKTDAAYVQYKKAFVMLQNAFNEYFGDNDGSDRGDLAVLREKLAGAKAEFSKVINDFPYTDWIDDSIDKINSINKWLE
ncbi:MAG TPA: hypothetical protein PK544_07545 [Spirochaetota bacterium]|mgnify:CR=1 FL=1|nr:hypothetical protein [Spirochaetota bacterium]